jgi:hypothetical protein
MQSWLPAAAGMSVIDTGPYYERYSGHTMKVSPRPWPAIAAR